MTHNRRNFCKNLVYTGLGLSFFPSTSYAKANKGITKRLLILTKKSEKVVKVNGKIQYEDLSPVQNATIEIWHNNSENNPSKFEYEGKLVTDSEGNYSFETDFPEKHFEKGHFRMRRIYFKIKVQNGEAFLTKLHFGYNGKALVDYAHVNNAPKKFKTVLPKTKFEEDLFTIQFDVYLNIKVATIFA